MPAKVKPLEPVPCPIWKCLWMRYRWKYCITHRCDLTHSGWDWEGFEWECRACVVGARTEAQRSWRRIT